MQRNRSAQLGLESIENRGSTAFFGSKNNTHVRSTGLVASLGQERADHQEERKEKERDESADLRGAADMKLPTKVVVDHV